MNVETLRRGRVAARIRQHRLVVVLRRVQPRDALLSLVEDLADAGARIFEVTLDGDGAASDIAALRAHLAGRDVDAMVGAGTVLRPEQLEAAVGAGADFAVSPVLDAELIAAGIAAGVPSIPGAFTPTEVAAGWRAGATFVKLFPASAAGPSFVRELRGPMPDVQLIPTGGVGEPEARAFLDAGAVAVGIGGALVNADPERRRVLVRAVAESPAR